MAISEKDWIAGLSKERPVLIAGPTASGKSSLALRVAEARGGPIVNADALQVFSDWRVLTARPSEEDQARETHHLYGHVPGDTAYSVGQWLRDLRPHLAESPVIVGGTGLYFTALTEGLAEIPPTPDTIRAEALARINDGEISDLLAELDPATRVLIDSQNPMRIQRAWEVLQTTGRGLAVWQDETPPPDLAPSDADAIVIDAPKDWLSPRIENRFYAMVRAGALEEAKRNSENWKPEMPSAKAIGARELIEHVRGERELEDAIAAAIIQTRQYAKRQRSWFRGRMSRWPTLKAASLRS